MGEKGEHEKMLILAFSDSEKAETGGRNDADGGSYEALINPESYSIDYKNNFAESGQGQGTSGKQLKFEKAPPAEMTFEFLFDNTGIIDGNPRDSIVEDLKKFKSVLMEFKGDSHEPRHLKLVWGENLIFKGRAEEVSIAFKMFKSDGTPIRAMAKVKFKASVEDKKRAAKDDKQSSDLTHLRKVRAGDTLPLMCHWIYGDPNRYLQVAQVNGLGNFRSLVPGMEILFPPIDKVGKSL